MNKRAKKRIKEAIEKENLVAAKKRQEQSLNPSGKLTQSRGFTAKPEKKRG